MSPHKRAYRHQLPNCRRGSQVRVGSTPFTLVIGALRWKSARGTALKHNREQCCTRWPCWKKGRKRQTAKSSELNWNVVEHNRKIRACKLLRNGGATRDRTDDLIVANDVALRDSLLIPQDLQAKHPLRTAIYWNKIGT